MHFVANVPIQLGDHTLQHRGSCLHLVKTPTDYDSASDSRKMLIKTGARALVPGSRRRVRQCFSQWLRFERRVPKQARPRPPPAPLSREPARPSAEESEPEAVAISRSPAEATAP